MRLNRIEQAILLTLAYSDIFNFPLTKEELWRFLISNKTVEKREFDKGLEKLIKVSKVSSVPGVSKAYYCLFGREFFVKKRVKNLSETEKKLIVAKKAVYYLSFILTIKFIGISGGLAIGNVDKYDDIDFFIISKKNSLFITRFLIALLLEILNLRRKRGDKNSENKICVNLLIDEDNLSWPSKMRDLYTAHEIIQIKPLFERKEIYKKFMAENSWIKKYFVNTSKESSLRAYSTSLVRSNLIEDIYSIFLQSIELPMRKLQENYMQKHKTTEIVSKGFIALHPKDYRTKTLTILRSKCRKLGLLTNF